MKCSSNQANCKSEIMDDFDWNVINEGYLLDAMVGHKPVGINKHFQMAFICERFVEATKKDIPSSSIWSHLETMYNLDALNENEALPFPNEVRDFTLPDIDYSALKKRREEQEEKRPLKSTSDTPKPSKEVKKEEKTTPASNRGIKNETPRRDSKEKESTKETKAPVKKEVKKEAEKGKPGKSRNSVVKEEGRKSSKHEESPRPAKRPTRGSMKADETNSGKASPVTITPTAKRRRI